MADVEMVWIFVGPKANFPSGVFSSLDSARQWISRHQLTGVLTEYPIDVSVYDWAISRGDFTPTKPIHSTPLFIGTFSSATQAHYHFEAGGCDELDVPSA